MNCRATPSLLFALAMSAVSIAAIPASAQTASQTANTLTPEVVVEAFHAALERSDGPAALALMSDDVLIYEGGRAERTKAEYASHHLKADAEFAAATKRQITHRKSHVVGELAWTVAETATSGSFRGRGIASTSTETMVLRQHSGAWKIVHIHWSSAAKR